MSPIGNDEASVIDDESGFTLLEVLVVLAIVGICIALLPPLTRSQNERTNLRSAVSVITAEIKASRQLAIREQREISLVFDTAENSFRQQPNGRPRHLPRDTTAQMEPLAVGDITVVPAITFYPDGTSSGGRVSVVSGSSSRTIAVSWPFGQLTHD